MTREEKNVNTGEEMAKKVFESSKKSKQVNEAVNSDEKIRKDYKSPMKSKHVDGSYEGDNSDEKVKTDYESSIKSGDNMGGSCEDTNQEEVGQRVIAKVKVKKSKGVNSVNPDNLEKIFDIEDLDQGSKSCLYSKRLNQAGGCSDCVKRPIGGGCK